MATSPLHRFTKETNKISLPDKFTFPFHYTPHPLSILASEQLQAYLQTKTEWYDVLAEEGKMFGVLVVQTQSKELGFLCAFSGNLNGRNDHPYFVPPIYNLLTTDGFFKTEEEKITQLNTTIKEIENESHYQSLLKKEITTIEKAQQEISEYKRIIKEKKELRNQQRLTNTDDTLLLRLNKESQHDKATLKRLEQDWKEKIKNIKEEISAFDSQINELKEERKNRSAILQKKIFEAFKILNYKKDSQNLVDIFSGTAQKTPPAGAGECAAPKLLQYAFENDLQPIAMAEFWWGESPKTEIRKHRHYYPACKGKCEPILNHMLMGLAIDQNPLKNDQSRALTLEILYEDEYLLAVNKPSGLLSAPGKLTSDSVYQRMIERYPECTGPLIVHRLDMGTSGILLVAKSKEIHRKLQMQFEKRSVKKRYIALLEKNILMKDGVISLPLCMNPFDRPRQMVDYKMGKQAVTRWEKLDPSEKRCRIAFFPETGRTHQLRVHAAHADGLNSPIIGDELYGKKAQRLYLHAESLEFTHPTSLELIKIKATCPF